MLESAIAINQFLLGQFRRTCQDLPEASLFEPAAGHGHSPVWVLGHLALTGELGVQLLGGQLTHPDWVSEFGPGSSGHVAARSELTREALATALFAAYDQLQSLAASATQDRLAQPHGIALFRDSPIRTVADAVTLLLTNHFGFHLAQLSSCRRSAGHAYLF